jgi:predicted ATP-grasp superfamily ATP-dependent carboligase
MATPVLLVLTAVRWVGAARMPRALAQAGFEVTLLTPPGSLAEKSAFVAKIAYQQDKTSPEDWVHAFAATAKATAPRLLVPCDDNAFRLLQLVATSPPQEMQPALHQELAALIAESFGDPGHYAASVDATSLPAAAAALGVRVPAHAWIADVTEAQAFGAAHGYPLVLNSRRTGAVATVRASADLAAAVSGLTTPAAAERSGSRDALLARAHVPGPMRSYQAAAWKGALLAGFAGERLPDPSRGGAQTGVSRYTRSDALRKVAADLARGFGISGLFSIEGIVAESGEFHLLEINRRLLGGAHRGSEFGVDLCAALHAALQGLPHAGRVDLDEGEEHVCVSFPQEWLRDPESKWLRDYPVDVPWDEPELFEAMLELQPTR